MSNSLIKSGVFNVYRGGVFSATFMHYQRACEYARMQARGSVCTVSRVNPTEDETPLYRVDLLTAAADWVLNPLVSRLLCDSSE